jgi:hypothetical protein
MIIGHEQMTCVVSVAVNTKPETTSRSVASEAKGCLFQGSRLRSAGSKAHGVPRHSVSPESGHWAQNQETGRQKV